MNIEAIYKKYNINLQRSGNKYKSTCPFHNEDTPSFFVYEDGSYHCFGCSAHGTLNDFVNKFDTNINKYLIAKTLDTISDVRYTNIIDSLERKLLKILEGKDVNTKYKIWKRFDLEFSVLIDTDNIVKRSINFLANIDEVLHDAER